MSDEQQPHRPDPGSGWQPMPHGPEYDAESTAFVQLPPDFQFPEPGDPAATRLGTARRARHRVHPAADARRFLF
ncbi:hypothetical protein SSOG_05401 [Streptomyces himastatinicus ATCC 53653]|uniref:Uncharacterized protein n=1 Tax=Streptomyces himastatinicus ATCC 53653 TaxID=457427 RepID=D9WKF3_9ACTN|nr:hypothetical protein [Streptomyces himastatinicus]EFL25687.1 hypothetical protein SSOG_05401 [Streptomyces himastatinicus ATCC 53653]